MCPYMHAIPRLVLWVCCAEVCNVHVNMHVYNVLVCPFICYNVVLLSHSYVVDICIDISLTIYSADEH